MFCFSFYFVVYRSRWIKIFITLRSHVQNCVGDAGVIGCCCCYGEIKVNFIAWISVIIHNPIHFLENPCRPSAVKADTHCFSPENSRCRHCSSAGLCEQLRTPYFSVRLCAILMNCDCSLNIADERCHNNFARWALKADVMAYSMHKLLSYRIRQQFFHTPYGV